MFGTEIRRNNPKKKERNNAKKSVINAFSSSPKSTIKCIQIPATLKLTYLQHSSVQYENVIFN